MRGLRANARVALQGVVNPLLCPGPKNMVKRRKWPRLADHATHCFVRNARERPSMAHRMVEGFRKRCHPVAGTWTQAAVHQARPGDGEDANSPFSGSHFSAADIAKEEAMMFRRTVYDQGDWIRHRSSARHVRHIVSIFSSRVVHALGLPVFILTTFAAAVASFNMAVLAGHFPSWVPLLQVSALPFQLTAPALALLLVFRTNASYGRFDEARKVWGMNVNRSMDLARQCLNWMTRPSDAERVKELLRYLVAFSYCLKHHLDREEGLQELLQEFLAKDETEAIMGAPLRPHFVLQKISDLIDKSEMLQMHKVQMDSNLTLLHDVVGSCERIYRTPIPLSYTRLTSRFLVFWHIALPLALWDDCNWYVVPAVCFSSATLFCIEEVGVIIEEPFGILAVEHMCLSVRQNVAHLVTSCSTIKNQREASKAMAKV